MASTRVASWVWSERIRAITPASPSSHRLYSFPELDDLLVRSMPIVFCEVTGVRKLAAYRSSISEALHWCRPCSHECFISYFSQHCFWSGCRLWLKGQVGGLDERPFASLRRYCFSFGFFIPSTNMWAASLLMKSSGTRQGLGGQLLDGSFMLLKWLSVPLDPYFKFKPAGRRQLFFSVKSIQSPGDVFICRPGWYTV
jgi:hypothetical protein